MRGNFFFFCLDKNSEKLLQPPLSVDYKQTLRPCLHSREIGMQNPWKRISPASWTHSVMLKRSFKSSVEHLPWAPQIFTGFCKWVIQRWLLSIKRFSLQNQSWWRRNAVCPVNIRRAGLDLEALSTDSRPRESAPNNKVKSQDCSHFAVFFLPFSIMLICCDFSDIIKNQISLEMKTLNLDQYGEKRRSFLSTCGSSNVLEQIPRSYSAPQMHLAPKPEITDVK